MRVGLCDGKSHSLKRGGQNFKAKGEVGPGRKIHVIRLSLGMHFRQSFVLLLVHSYPGENHAHSRILPPFVMDSVLDRASFVLRILLPQFEHLGLVE